MGEKTKGWKRHIATAIMGNLLCIKVHAANRQGIVASCEVILVAFKKYPSLKIVCTDAGYRKTVKEYAEISEKIKPKEWAILPKGWRAERTLSWLNGSRRLSKD